VYPIQAKGTASEVKPALVKILISSGAKTMKPRKAMVTHLAKGSILIAFL